MDPVTPVQAVFSTQQITDITTALNSAITNTLTMFVSLLPIAATLAGVAFGIRSVKGYFGQAKNGK